MATTEERDIFNNEYVQIYTNGSIPVPNLEEARYGISDMTGIYIPLNIKNFYILSPCFSKYDNLYHYILESAKQAIDAAFTYGFTCNGKRIKKKEFITNSTTD